MLIVLLVVVDVRKQRVSVTTPVSRQSAMSGVRGTAISSIRSKTISAVEAALVSTQFTVPK